MFRETAKLVVYKNQPEDSILLQLAAICEEFVRGGYQKEQLTARIYEQVHRLLDVATRYGFNQNLWHNYLAYILAMTENPFSITCEKTGANDGSVNELVKSDYQAFLNLFHYDFSGIEEALGIQCFSILTNYHSIVKPERRYNRNVSEKVQALSQELEGAQNAEDVFRIVTNFYYENGVGMFGLNKAFRVLDGGVEGQAILEPITNIGNVTLDDLIGYDIQKQQLIENTEAFVKGHKANNVLLYGDAGTGKSTSIKAILNRYYDQGLRMIEIYKHQFHDLASVIQQIKNRNYRFIIYMDDLSFEEFEIEYKYLKAVIEGGLEIKPDNVLIYATSNRRHLIRETWSDRSDMSQDELHRSDTMQEKLSLVARFGVSISFSKPSQKQFFEMVCELAKRNPAIHLTDEELRAEANKWSMRNGGLSGRTAAQFISHLECMK